MTVRQILLSSVRNPMGNSICSKPSAVLPSRWKVYPLLTVAMSTPVSAADLNEILKSTPELDGKLNNTFTQSVVYTIVNTAVAYT